MLRVFAFIASIALFSAGLVRAEELMTPQSSVTTLEVPAPEALSAEEKAKIEQALKSGYGNVQLKFVPSPSADAERFLGGGFICKPLCAAAYTAATVACAGLSGPLVGVCTSAAALANEECLKRCK